LMADSDKRVLPRLIDAPAAHKRLFTDKVFSFDDWNRHRNATWRHRPEPVIFLRVATGLAYQLCTVLISSLIVVLYHVYAVPRGAPSATVHLSSAFGMTTFALSLLLVFKTNSSYARWWEGRIIWGQVVNFARNLPRQFLCWVPPGPESEVLGRSLLRWTAAAPNILRGHIIEKSAGRCVCNAAHVLLPHEQAWLAQFRNGPMGVALELSRICARARGLGFLTDIQAAALEQQIALYTNMYGACERIQRTPLPEAYTRHTSRFLNIYVTLSPILLWPAVTWATPAVAIIIAFLLLGTENIGAQIEEPFWLFPLGDICASADGVLSEVEAVWFGDKGLSPTPEAVAAKKQQEGHHLAKAGFNPLNREKLHDHREGVLGRLSLSRDASNSNSTPDRMLSRESRNIPSSWSLDPAAMDGTVNIHVSAAGGDGFGLQRRVSGAEEGACGNGAASVGGGGTALSAQTSLSCAGAARYASESDPRCPKLAPGAAAPAHCERTSLEQVPVRSSCNAGSTLST